MADREERYLVATMSFELCEGEILLEKIFGKFLKDEAL